MTLLEAGQTPYFMLIDVEDQEGKDDSQPKAPEALTAEEEKKTEPEGRTAYKRQNTYYYLQICLNIIMMDYSIVDTNNHM